MLKQYASSDPFLPSTNSSSSNRDDDEDDDDDDGDDNETARSINLFYRLKGWLFECVYGRRRV